MDGYLRTRMDSVMLHSESHRCPCRPRESWFPVQNAWVPAIYWSSRGLQSSRGKPEKDVDGPVCDPRPRTCIGTESGRSACHHRRRAPRISSRQRHETNHPTGGRHRENEQRQDGMRETAAVREDRHRKPGPSDDCADSRERTESDLVRIITPCRIPRTWPS